MHAQREVSQVRSQRNSCSGSAGSTNSTQSRGKSSGTSPVAGERPTPDWSAASRTPIRTGLLDMPPSLPVPAPRMRRTAKTVERKRQRVGAEQLS